MVDSHKRLLTVGFAVVCLLGTAVPAASGAPRSVAVAGVTGATGYLFDTTPPTATLVKPTDNHWQGATFVTGKDFLLVGTAEDQWGVERAWFELCPGGEAACVEEWNSAPGDDNWRAIGDVPANEAPGIPGQYQTEWDSVTVADGFYFIRVCAENTAGNGNCWDSRTDLPLVSEDGAEHLNPYPDAHWVYVSNQIECPLQVGWNLISTPLLPYDTDIQNVMSHLVDHGTVEAAWSMFNQDDARVWKVWTPTAGPVDTLMTIVDGQGYWIKMKANDTLTITGTWTIPGWGAPPAYHVHDGWNLIGYTQWGRPTFMPADTAGDYLGEWLIDVCTLFYYDPWFNVWVKLFEPHNMLPCKGYWLSCGEAGVIRF